MPSRPRGFALAGQSRSSQVGSDTSSACVLSVKGSQPDIRSCNCNDSVRVTRRARRCPHAVVFRTCRCGRQLGTPH